MKSYKGGGKYTKATAKPIKKKSLKSKTLRTKGLAKFKLKTLKRIQRKPEKIMERFIKEKGDDFDTYYNALKGFQILFKNMLKEEDALHNEENNKKQLEYDMIKTNILDKLENIEKKGEGNILMRIKKISPDIYIKVQRIYERTGGEDKVNSDTILPFHTLIEYYYEIIRKLLNIYNNEVDNNIINVITFLSIDLTSEFFDKKIIEKEEMEDDLSSMFSEMKVGKNAVSDLLNGFSAMKLSKMNIE